MAIADLFRSSRQDQDVAAAFAPGVPSNLQQAYVQAGVFGTVSRDLAMSIPAAWACRQLIASTIAQLNVTRYRGTEEVPNGALFIQPDPDVPWSATIAGTVEDLLLFGQAAWLILARDGISTDRNPKGLPVRARRIPMDQVEVKLSDSYSDYSRVQGYVVNGSEVERDDIILFDAGHPGVLRYGARALRAAWDVEEAARRFATVDLPAGILYAEGHELGLDEAAEIVQAFTTARTNRSVALLQHARYERVQLSPDELALDEMRAATDREVARLFGVPVAMIAASPSGSGGSTMTYANVTQNMLTLLQTAVAPVLSALERTFSSSQVTPLGQTVHFAVAAFLRSDPAASLEYAAQLFQVGVIDQAEARSFLGIPPVGSTTPTITPGKV